MVTLRRGMLMVTLLAACALPVLARDKDRSRPQDLLLREDHPPIPAEHLALEEVPYAPGQPAVTLLAAEQNEWQGNDFMRTTYVRRVKILTEAGVEEYGDAQINFYGELRMKEIRARTVLPDGTEVDASGDAHHETSDAGIQILRVAFPRVQVGAILDLHVTYTSDGWGLPPWVLQEHIPVLESRFIMVPPTGLRFRTAGYRLSDAESTPQTFISGLREKAYAWSFTDIEPVPQEPNMPPLEDVSKRLFVILARTSTPRAPSPIQAEWMAFSDRLLEGWQAWLRAGQSRAASLARQVAGEAASPREKAEAVRRALAERVRVSYLSTYPLQDSPDQVLKEGAGTSADVAGAAVAMLRAVGVEADLAAIRRRGEGKILMEFPIPVLFNDLLVRLPDAGGDLFFSPVSAIPVGQLPWDCSGVLAVPIWKGHQGPVGVPALAAADNRTVQAATVKLTADGALAGESITTHSGAAAESWRRRLEDLPADRRQEVIQERLRRWMPGARLTSLEIENLELAAGDLILKYRWEAEPYASAAGQRLLVNPHLFHRVDPRDWPAGDRRTDLELGSPYEVEDQVVLELPAGTTGVALPEPARLDAGPVGLYEASFTAEGSALTVRRAMRLDQVSFPASLYGALAAWFGDIARADDRPLVVTLE